MPEFLVRVEGAARFSRVEADEPGAVGLALGPGWGEATAFSGSGRAWRLVEGLDPEAGPARLPFAARAAWWGARHPEVRLVAQWACWLALGALLALDSVTDRRLQAPPAAMVLVGGLNLLAWWWWEADKGRLEPEVLRPPG